jgi:DNA-binding IclR family transcriptional regulator
MAVSASSSIERTPRADGGMQVISRASAILRQLALAPRGRSLAELADAVDLPRSTVHRLVKALELEGFVTPVTATAGFRLGPGLLQLANTSRDWLVARLHRELLDLSERLGETVDLAVLAGDRVLFIDQVVRPQRLQTVSAVGVSFALHSTANGKALLASLDERQVRDLLPSRLPRLTRHTVTGIRALLAELEDVRATGIAWDREENDIGICAVGTAIETPVGVLVAVSVPVPASRFADRGDALARALLASRRRIEKRLAADERSGPIARERPLEDPA